MFKTGGFPLFSYKYGYAGPGNEYLSLVVVQCVSVNREMLCQVMNILVWWLSSVCL